MTDGLELIKWAVKQCDLKGLPPLDCNILMFIRKWDGGKA